jgi:hypothetical protein
MAQDAMRLLEEIRDLLRELRDHAHRNRERR